MNSHLFLPKMFKILVTITSKWPEKSFHNLISAISFIVFVMLDLLDIIFCLFYRLVDGYMEDKNTNIPCYCGNREALGRSVNGDEEDNRENELSKTLYHRKNIFRDLGFLNKLITKDGEGKCSNSKKKVDVSILKNRWSDCNCESCLSWQKLEDKKLHVVIKEPSQGEVAERKLWPPSDFGCSIMSWYEHLGRTICFLICRNHRNWEHLLKLLSRKRDLSFLVMDLTRHTHHSARHTMHNVICGGAKLMDGYLEPMNSSQIFMTIIRGDNNQTVPMECIHKMKLKVPSAVVKIISNANHNSLILREKKNFTRDMEHIWTSGAANYKWKACT